MFVVLIVSEFCSLTLCVCCCAVGGLRAILETLELSNGRPETSRCWLSITRVDEGDLIYAMCVYR